MGAGHRQDQRHHGGLGGHLPRPLRRRDGQEPEGGRRRRTRARHAAHGSRQGEADDVNDHSTGSRVSQFYSLKEEKVVRRPDTGAHYYYTLTIPSIKYALIIIN